MSVFVQLVFSINSCCLLFCDYNILRYNIVIPVFDGLEAHPLWASMSI